MNLGWCWLPGVSFGFNFWSPGLVRFYHGPNWVSWCPLGPGDYYNVHNYHYRPAHNYYLNNLRMAQRRGPMDLANRDVAGAFRTVNRDQFVNGSAAGRGRLAQLENVDRPWVNGRMAADSLDIRPTAQSIAPAPDRAASVPTHSGGRLPAVIRTEPALARGGGTDRFVRISGAPVSPDAQGTASRMVPGGGEASGGVTARSAGGSISAGSAPQRSVPFSSSLAPDSGSGRNGRTEPGTSGGRGSDPSEAASQSSAPRYFGRTIGERGAGSAGETPGRTSPNGPSRSAGEPATSGRETASPMPRWSPPAYQEPPRWQSAPVSPPVYGRP